MASLMSNLELFLNYFPEIELPVLLGENTHLAFSQQNQPIPGELIAQYIYEPSDGREWVEIIPCFRFKAKNHMVVCVYWEAGLLYYDYHILVLDQTGGVVNDQVIGGLRSDGRSLIRTIVHIDAGPVFYVVSAFQSDEREEIDFNEAVSERWILVDDGKLVKEG